MATTREIRTIRIEDWEGNIYRPEGVGSGSGGVVTPADEIGKGGSSTDGTLVEDSTSNNGTSIEVSSDPSSDMNIATMIFDDVSFGEYSIMTRLKTSNNASPNALVRIETFYYIEGFEENKLSSTDVLGSYFVSNNMYQSFGFVMKFMGNYDKNMKLKVVMTLLKRPEAVTVNFDSLVLNKAYTSLTGLSTVLYDK